MTLRFLTAGESHGRALTGIIEGIPSLLSISEEDLNRELARRQGGYGRGGRMKIEQDRAKILSGVRWGKSIGGPITLMIENKDFENWQEAMSPYAEHAGSKEPVTRPRPGHADLSGIQKYGLTDIRDVLERSSARETAMRVALGSVCRQMLWSVGISIGSYVTSIGSASCAHKPQKDKELVSYFKKAEKSPLRCAEKDAERMMKAEIDKAMNAGDTVGGTFTVFALGVPPGLGSYVQWDRRLDGRLAQAFMSIQAIKGVEIGSGFSAAYNHGSKVMDEITNKQNMLGAYIRRSNDAGGIEGGMTNGMPVIINAGMKPIPTLRRPLKSIDLKTGAPSKASYERSDICAVPAASVIAEAMAAFVLCGSFMEKFGSDSMPEIISNYESYISCLKAQ